MATTKTTAKKPAVSKKTQTETKAQASSLEGLANRMLDVADAGLGFYGTLFDTTQARLAELCDAAPERLEAYIKRGQKMRKDVSEAIEGQEFPAAFDTAEIREQMENAVEKVQSFFKPVTA